MATGDGEAQFGRDVTVDGSNNVITTGYFHGTVDFGDGPMVAAGTDLFIARFGPLPTAVLPSPGGDLLWLNSYPNPFNPTTTIAYSIPETGFVRLCVYDARGRLVRSLVDENKTRGEYTVPWDGRDAEGIEVGSGVFFLRLEAGALGQTFKIVTVK